MKRYPRAHARRPSVTSQTVRQRRLAFFKAAGLNFLLLQLLFLGLYAYVFGSIFQQNDRIKHMKVLYVDYDGGVVGDSVRNAYNTLKANGFPTIVEHSVSDYPTVADMRDAVCEIRYWAAIFTSSGTSQRLQDALAIGGDTAASYDRSDALAYIWNQARYPAIADSAISNSLKSLSQQARVEYTSNAEAGPLQSFNSTDPTAFSILADPWELQSMNIQPTVQGARLVYNTIVIILILIQEFFYLGTINGLYAQFKIYTSNINPHRVIVVRAVISVAYCFVGSLCTVGAIWAYRGGWDVNANQFVISWMVLWLFAHVNFLTLDVFTIWLPIAYVPMALITWVMLNVASILVPFELSSPFYRWAYAMPSHEVYQILVDIWSGGCNPQLHHALPVLFVLEIVALILSAVGVHRRAHYATIAEDAAEEAMRARIGTAVAIELDRGEAEKERVQREKDQQGTIAEEAEPKRDAGAASSHDSDDEEREDIEEALRREETAISRQRSASSRTVDFGPSFTLAFGNSQND